MLMVMKEEKDPQLVTHLIKDFGDSGLRKIVRQAQRLAAIDRILKNTLPEGLKAHCQASQTNISELTILVDSAAWLTHLRYIKSQLLQQLKKHPQFNYLQDIRFRIDPLAQLTPNISKNITHKSGVLSTQNKELVKSLADSIENGDLRAALLNLIRD